MRPAPIFGRVCRRHGALCVEDLAADEVRCPRGHVVGSAEYDVVRLGDGHVAHTGGKGMKTMATRKFVDEAGNVLFLRVTTAKRTPYVLRVQAVDKNGGSKSGVLGTAGDLQVADTKLDQLAEDALKRGWREAPGRADGLTEIPLATKVPRGGGGFAAAAARR